MSELRVIGVGDPDRGDDAAGVAVAERVGGQVVAGDLAAVAGSWRPDDDVVVVDTMVSGAPPGTVRWIELDELTDGPDAPTGRAARAVALAADSGRLPARLRVVAIEGASFEPGAPLSPEVQLAVEEMERVLGP